MNIAAANMTALSEAPAGNGPGPTDTQPRIAPRGNPPLDPAAVRLAEHMLGKIVGH